MQVSLRCARGPEGCWNIDAIEAYAKRQTTREAGIAAATMLALVFGLFPALIQGVSAFIRARRTV